MKEYTLDVQITKVTRAKVAIEAESKEEAIDIWKEEGFDGCIEFADVRETISSNIIVPKEGNKV